MKKTIGVLKIVLFIAILCLAILFFSQTKVSAKTVIVTTLQELQEIMGATSYSTIEGTTLKITDNFTWNLTDDVDMRIPELTIDFNGKEMRIENDKRTNLGIHLSEGKVILKDSQGETGGIYSIGNFIYLEHDTELIIENGQYTAGHVQEIDNGLITNIDNGLIKNQGGNITVKNGKFNTTEYAILFNCNSGKLIINDGNFTGKGYFVEVRSRRNCLARFGSCY